MTLAGTEGPDGLEKGTTLSHLIGIKDEDVHFLPDLSSKPVGKHARRDFSEREKYALIEEDGEAHNVHKLDTTGTHYEDQSAAEIARMILPLKGL